MLISLLRTIEHIIFDIDNNRSYLTYTKSIFLKIFFLDFRIQ
jgi:hypothetical protein